MKLPKSEINSAPSIAVFQPVTEQSVRSRLTEDEIAKMPTNGHSIETLRDFSPMNRHDKIDQIGIATKLLSESAGKYSKSELHSALLKQSQQLKKPKTK